MRVAIPLCVVLAAAAAHADVAEGKKLNVEGMKLVKKQDWFGALQLFKKAIDADPDAVFPHYNAASMESRLDEHDDLLKELAWLAASKDPAAAKALVKAKTDPDLERASMDPRVRKAIGLPELASMTGDAIALERSGVWGENGSACGGQALTLKFKKGGKLTVHTEAGCDDNYDKSDEPGTWKANGNGVTLTSKTVFKGGAEATIGPCEEQRPAAQCLVVKDGDHAFWRGPGELL
jgi:hypothetical protein